MPKKRKRSLAEGIALLKHLFFWSAWIGWGDSSADRKSAAHPLRTEAREDFESLGMITEARGTQALLQSGLGSWQ